jgi:hypothetical protein
MQRGSYTVGVSAFEKVTQYCSTKSKVGGKFFLELTMAYEAEGNSDQAYGLYATLTKSPIQYIKMNADRQLYGLEAMNFIPAHRELWGHMECLIHWRWLLARFCAESKLQYGAQGYLISFVELVFGMAKE